MSIQGFSKKTAHACDSSFPSDVAADVVVVVFFSDVVKWQVWDFGNRCRNLRKRGTRHQTETAVIQHLWMDAPAPAHTCSSPINQLVFESISLSFVIVSYV